MTLSGDTIGAVFIYLVFLISVAISVKAYFKIPHPDARGMIGIIAILAITIIFFTVKAFFWNNPRAPIYLNLPPIAITMPIYYLTIKPGRSRKDNTYMAIVLILMVVFSAILISGI